MPKGVETPALLVTAALLVPAVGFAVQAPPAVQEEADALEAAMFAAVTVVDAANGERIANERLNSFQRGTPRTVEERSRDTDALSWWTEQGLSPIAARRAAVRHWRKTRERREAHFRKQAAIYAEIAGVSVETAVERALAARDEYLGRFSAEALSRIQARMERFEQWKLGWRQDLLEHRQQILENLGDLDAIGSDGLSIRARACGQALRERVEDELSRPGLDPVEGPTVHREDLAGPVAGIVRSSMERMVGRFEKRITETSKWGPCAQGELGMRATYVALRELR